MGKKFIVVYLSFLLFTFHFSLAQTWLWGKMGIGDCWVTSIASDKDGSCYLAGLFPYDTILFGNDSVKNSSEINNNDEQFLVKLDQYGNVIWAKQTINLNSNIYVATSSPCSISLDGSGNIYVNGNFPDTLLVGSFTLINNLLSNRSANTFIAKYDPNGNVIWAEKATVHNDSSDIGGKGIASDNYGNSYTTGSFVDTIQFGTETITTPSSNIVYAFLAKYNSNGNVKWVRQSTGNTRYGATSLCAACDLYGNSIIGGYFDDSVTFGSYKLGSIPSSTVGDMFITKYDSNGNVLWARQAVIPNSNSGCKAWTLATDISGNIYVSGDYESTITLGTYTITGTSYNNFFLAKLDPSGNTLWIKGSNGFGSDNFGAQKMSVDNNSHVYLSAVGGTSGTLCKVVFGGDTLSLFDSALYDGVSLIYKVDSNGNVLCSSVIEGGADLNCIASDTSGNYIYFGGTTATEMVFGNDTINPFSFHANYGYNFFPFTARWEGCDSNIVTAIVPMKNNIEEVKVYPNPNNGSFILSLTNVNYKCNIEIYNMLGGKIYTEALSETQENHINLIGQPNGVYLYRILKEDGNLVGSGKVIIEK